MRKLRERIKSRYGWGRYLKWHRQKRTCRRDRMDTQGGIQD